MTQKKIETNSELMLKALNKFGLKLPEDSTAVLFNKQEKITTWISSSGNPPEECNNFNSEFWSILCTNEQYNLFVDNLFSVGMNLKTLFSLNTDLQNHFSEQFADKYSLTLK